MLFSIHRHDARNVLRRVNDEVVAREHVFLREAVDATHIVELAMADLVFIAVGVISSAVPLLERPWLIRDDAVRRIDDEALSTEHAEATRVLLENDRMGDAARGPVEGSSEIRVAVGSAWDRPTLGRRCSLRTVDTCQPSRTSELAGSWDRRCDEQHRRRNDRQDDTSSGAHAFHPFTSLRRNLSAMCGGCRAGRAWRCTRSRGGRRLSAAGSSCESSMAE